jgi:hypothetical protein
MQRFFFFCCHIFLNVAGCSFNILLGYSLVLCSRLIKKFKCKKNIKNIKNILSVLSLAIMLDRSDLGLAAMPDA